MPRNSQLSRTVPVFAALGDRTRLELVARLSKGPSSITKLTAGSAISRQAITKHLHVLADAGLVRGRQRGRERIWEFDAARISEAQCCLDEISRQWDAALERLKRLVEH